MSYRFTAGREDDGSTVRTFLRHSCGVTARSMTILKYSDGGIYRGDKMLKAHDILHEGDVLTIKLPNEANEIVPVEGALDILYEDEFLLIVNKPDGMPVHPVRQHQTDTLANIVSFYQRNRGESYVFRALNRLDKDTSGCVVIAKDRLTYAIVKDSVEKIYVAVCEGEIDSADVIDRPIGLADDSKMKRVVREDGSNAVTHYRPIAVGSGHTLLELWLETGRTHQIRCHMSSFGHPLAGDDLYGGSRRLIRRQALHCRDVSFVHPVTKETIAVRTEIPAEFLQLLKEG